MAGPDIANATTQVTEERAEHVVAPPGAVKPGTKTVKHCALAVAKLLEIQESESERKTFEKLTSEAEYKDTKRQTLRRWCKSLSKKGHKTVDEMSNLVDGPHASEDFFKFLKR